MKKELKELVLPVFKMEIIFCILLTFITVVINNKGLIISFQVGLLVASVNFLISAYILHNNLSKSNTLLIVFSTVSRILIILVLAIPFISNFGSLIMYILGFTVHFPIMIIFWFTKVKGCS